MRNFILERILRKRRGATMVETAALLLLIALVGAAAVPPVGVAAREAYKCFLLESGYTKYSDNAPIFDQIEYEEAKRYKVFACTEPGGLDCDPSAAPCKSCEEDPTQEGCAEGFI